MYVNYALTLGVNVKAISTIDVFILRKQYAKVCITFYLHTMMSSLTDQNLNLGSEQTF